MGTTPHRGWMKREFSRYPVGSLVKHDKAFYANVGKVGQIMRHYIHKNSLPCAWIAYDDDNLNGFPLRILTKVD